MTLNRNIWGGVQKFVVFRARYYNPMIGRFISEDPTGFAAGEMDLYGTQAMTRSIIRTRLVSIRIRLHSPQISSRNRNSSHKNISAAILRDSLRRGTALKRLVPLGSGLERC